MSPPPSEFQIIKCFFENVGPALSDEQAIGIGDDCALVNIPDGMSLCLSIDTMVEGVHFPKACPPSKIAYRALAAALSDLAAMGAAPSHFTLALTLSDPKVSWLAEFAKGLSELAGRFHLSLVGGDTTKGPLTITLQVHGFVPSGMALQRSGAKQGHKLAVTGGLGDAGAALSLLHSENLNRNQTFLLDRYYRPTPRIDQGLQLRGLASSCIDISDGLLADAGHLAEKSGVGLIIDSGKIPISSALSDEIGSCARNLAFSAGDDYELLFTISEKNWRKLTENYSGHIYTLIGEVVNGEGVTVCQDGDPINITQKGFQHFE